MIRTLSICVGIVLSGAVCAQDEQASPDSFVWRLDGPAILVDSCRLGQEGIVCLYRGEFLRDGSTGGAQTKTIYWLEVSASDWAEARVLEYWGTQTGECRHLIAGARVQMRDARRGAVAWAQWPFVFLTEITLPPNLRDLQAMEPSPRVADNHLTTKTSHFDTSQVRPGLRIAPNCSMDMFSLRVDLENAGILVDGDCSLPIDATDLKWHQGTHQWEVVLKVSTKPTVGQLGIGKRVVSLFRIASQDRWQLGFSDAHNVPVSQPSVAPELVQETGLSGAVCPQNEPSAPGSVVWRLDGPAILVDSCRPGGDGTVCLYRGEFRRDGFTDREMGKTLYWVEGSASNAEKAYVVKRWGRLTGESRHPIAGAGVQMRDDRRGAVAWAQWPFIFLTEITLPVDLRERQAMEISPRIAGHIPPPKTYHFVMPRVPLRLAVAPLPYWDMFSPRELLEKAGMLVEGDCDEPIHVSALRWRQDTRRWEVVLTVSTKLTDGPLDMEKRAVSLFRVASDDRWQLRLPDAHDPPVNQRNAAPGPP